MQPQIYDDTCSSMGGCTHVKQWGVDNDELFPNRMIYPKKKMLTFSEELDAPMGQSPMDWRGRLAVLGRLDNQVIMAKAQGFFIPSDERGGGTYQPNNWLAEEDENEGLSQIGAVEEVLEVGPINAVPEDNVLMIFFRARENIRN
jgi:hypothetical protein